MKQKLLALALITLITFGGCQGGTSGESLNNIENSTTSQNTVETQENEIKENLPETEDKNETMKREDSDFRNAKWGDDIDTVKKYKNEIKLEWSEEDEFLFGVTNINGIDAIVCYYFDNKVLHEAGYIFVPEYSNEGQFINSYENMKELFIRKYGTPESDEIVPMEEQDMIDYVGPVSALSYGYVQYKTIWSVEDTKIGMVMLSKNYKINWGVVYSDKNHEDDINDYGI